MTLTEERVRDLFALLQLVDNKELADELYVILQNNSWMIDGSDERGRPLRIWYLKQAIHRALDAQRDGGATPTDVAFVRNAFGELDQTDHGYEIAVSQEFSDWIASNQKVVEDFLRHEETKLQTKENDDE